jgi:hypothetical protein
MKPAPKALLKPLPASVINSMDDTEVEAIVKAVTVRRQEQLEAEQRAALARNAYNELFFVRQSLERHCQELDANKKRLVEDAMTLWKAPLHAG